MLAVGIEVQKEVEVEAVGEVGHVGQLVVSQFAVQLFQFAALTALGGLVAAK